MKPIFQERVLQSYIDNQDEKLIASRWEKFQNFKDKIFSIKKMKEEKYQDGFLTDIFVECLGYTIDTQNPKNYNLERERKNESDSKKVDGAITVDENVVGYIELKGQDTKDLEKTPKDGLSPVDQAFRYMYSNSSEFGKYVIVSNFDELRFYIKDKMKYENFSLFNLSEKEFKKLHTILSFESIKIDLPLEIKEKSVTFEVDISNKFYKDYVKFRTELFENILEKNQNQNKLELLNLTQKLIDRIVFILFAEDTTLLPLNTIYTIIKNHKEHNFEDKSLYKFYQIYFNAINNGSTNLNINKYNGGLFAQDTRLDELIIDDAVLHEQAKILSAYNFGSDISVNILGHIFEQSISDLEELTAQINEDSFDKKDSKRKKDGIFYTPAYITSYIVENTLGKMCRDKREELNLLHVETLASGKKPTKKITKQKKDLTLYKEWITNLKILDPACGSGAFLNQALEFLLQEHKNIQNDFQKLGDILSSYEIDKTILENNLYGVDINESAVEIAKLSLWLKTANNKRPLTKLANKIKCGNSLIDDKSVVENAFVWEKEFPEVFENGGFDVVIGNPPWGADISAEHLEYLKNKYPLFSSKTNDSYLFFTFLSLNILKENGMFGFIIPNSWMLINTAKDIRSELLEYDILNIIDYGDGVFENVTAESSTLIIRNRIDNLESVRVKKLKNNIELFTYNINKKNWLKDAYKRIILEKNNEIYNFILKIKENSIYFNEIAEIIWGIKPYQVGHGTPKQTKEMLKDRIYHSEIKIDSTYKPLLVGSNINKYSLYFNNNLFIKYGNNLMYPSNENKMINAKLLMRQTSDKLRVVYDDKSYYCQNSIFIITSSKINLLYLNVLLNSKLLNFLYTMDNPQKGKTFAEIKPSVVKELPIINITNELQMPYIEKAKIMLELTKNLQETKQNFITDLELEKVPKKLQNFENLSFEEFIKELKKAKKLKFETKLQERELKDEWRGLFEKDTKEILELKSQIDKTDKEIDKMVYELYGLSDEEINLVEGAL